MNTQVTKLQAAEDGLKQLMADVTRAMERAQEAVARITSNGAAIADTKSDEKRSFDRTGSAICTNTIGNE
jgi:hypothetical protein